MKLRPLDREYFEATLISPVRRITDEEAPDIRLAEYLHACDETYQLLPENRKFDALRLFLSGDNLHLHAVFWFGHQERVLVLVLNRLTGTIVGHHLLHLPDQPDTHACGVPAPKPPDHLVRSEAKDLPASHDPSCRERSHR